jgi:hypothetical protein
MYVCIFVAFIYIYIYILKKTLSGGSGGACWSSPVAAPACRGRPCCVAPASMNRDSLMPSRMRYEMRHRIKRKRRRLRYSYVNACVTDTLRMRYEMRHRIKQKRRPLRYSYVNACVTDTLRMRYEMRHLIRRKRRRLQPFFPTRKHAPAAGRAILRSSTSSIFRILRLSTRNTAPRTRRGSEWGGVGHGGGGRRGAGGRGAVAGGRRGAGGRGAVAGAEVRGGCGC